MAVFTAILRTLKHIKFFINFCYRRFLLLTPEDLTGIVRITMDASCICTSHSLSCISSSVRLCLSQRPGRSVLSRVLTLYARSKMLLQLRPTTYYVCTFGAFILCMGRKSPVETNIGNKMRCFRGKFLSFEGPNS